VKKGLIYTLLFLSFGAFAQRNKPSMEVGVFLGGSYYIGEINQQHLGQFTKPAGGLVFRYNFNRRLAARANAWYGIVEAHDSYSESAAQKQRNMSFKSDISEISAVLEFNFLDYELGNENRRFSPYIFGGFAGYKFKPQVDFGGQWVNAQPLATEGQGLPGGASNRKYKLTQVSLPFGVGFKTHLAESIGLSVEWGMRKTFTDYIDDVSTEYYDPAVLAIAYGPTSAAVSDPSIGTDPNYSNVGRQRGNPTNKDWYSFIGFIFTIKIKSKPNACPAIFN